MKKNLAVLAGMLMLLASSAVLGQRPTVTPQPEGFVREAESSALMHAQATPAASATPTSTPECPASPDRPAMARPLREGATQITGVSTPFQSPCTARIDVYDVSSGTAELLATASNGLTLDGSNGNFALTLAEPLHEGQRIAVQEVFSNGGVHHVPGDTDLVASGVDVVVPGDWGRVKAYFVSGILVSQGQQSFSQSSLFMGFTLDKAWMLPGYYHPLKTKEKTDTHKQPKKPAKTGSVELEDGFMAASRGPAATYEADDERQPGSEQDPGAGTVTRHGKGAWWRPGVNTYFDVRLTQIPVSACSSTATTNSNQASPCATPAATPTPSPSPSPTTSLNTFLSSQKSARLSVGIYFPFSLTVWNYNRIPNALFIAPLAKVGFDTPAGALNQIEPASAGSGVATTNTGTVTAVNQANFYNFYTFGARIGHYGLTSSSDRAPDLISYVDVSFGPFSNLETLVLPKGAPTGTTPGTKRLYRVSLEGILKIPTTPLIIGLSGNIGQEAVGLGKFNIQQRAGDDLRFLFGVKFDVAKLLAKVTEKAP